MRAQSKQSNFSTYLNQTVLVVLHFFSIVTPIYFSFQTSELFEFNKMLLVYGCTLIVVTAWLLRMALEGKFQFKRTYLDIPLLLFLISQLLSTWFSIHPFTSVFGYYSRFHGGLLSSISYIALYYVVVNVLDKNDIKKVAYSLFFSSIIVGIYAVLEHFGHSFSCFLSSNGTDFGVDCWIQDVQNRVFATFGQPNWLAAYAITLIPLGLYGALFSKKDKIKIFFMSALFLLWLSLIFSKSRSGALGFIASALMMLVALWYKRILDKHRKYLSIITIGLVSSGLIFGTPFTQSIFTKLQSNPQQQTEQPTQVVNRLDVGGTDSGEIRKIVWQGALNVWKRYPILGSGLETFAYSYYQDRPMEHNTVSEWDFLYNKAHNELLNIAATSGIVGLLAYLFLLGSFALKTLIHFLKKDHNSSEQQFLLLMLLSGVVAQSVSNFFGFSTVVVSAIMFLYFAFSAIILSSKKEEIGISLSTTSKYVSQTVLVFAFLFLFHRLINYRQADVLFTSGKNLYSIGQYPAALEQLYGAVALAPNQAEFYSELADSYSELALQLSAADATAAAELEKQAVIYSDQAITLNPRHLNMYKDRLRVFILLSQIKPQYIEQAKQTVELAQVLSPTDPKLVYHQSLLEYDLGHLDTSKKLLEKAIEMKPNYEQARFELAEQYEADGEIDKALEQHQYIVDHIAHNQLSIEKIEELKSKD